MSVDRSIYWNLNASNSIPGVKKVMSESSLFLMRLRMFSPSPGTGL